MIGTGLLAGSLAQAAVAENKPEIEFNVLLIIKQESDSCHPLFLPVRSRMTEGEIKRARQCFEVETPDMVKDITGGKVRFVPTVVVSKTPLRVWDPQRLDSAEYCRQELLNELYTFAKPGQFDSVGYYFLHYDTATGYRIPRAGYGVGGYDGSHALGMFAVNCAQQMNVRDEVFLHEWMHGLDGFFGNKRGVKLPGGSLHGNAEHGYREAKAWRPGDTFKGWMEWYRDYLTANVQEGDQKVGLGSVAWKHGPMRKEAFKAARNYRPAPLPIKTYPAWVYQLMKGDLSHAVLGQPLLKDLIAPGAIAKTSWELEAWNSNAGTKAKVAALGGGAFEIDSPSPNDARLVRAVAVLPSKNYVFSAEVKTERVEITQAGGRYAVNLHAGDSVSTQDLTGSKDWTPVVIAFTTGPKADTCRLKMALGGFASQARGRAYFRNVQVRQVGYPAADTPLR